MFPTDNGAWDMTSHPMLPLFQTDEIMTSKAEGNSFQYMPWWYSVSNGFSYHPLGDFATNYGYNPSSVNICVMSSPSADEYCYSLYIRVQEQCLETGAGVGVEQPVGEFFYYGNDDGYINSLDIGASFGSAFNRNNSIIRLEFFRLDNTLQPAETLYVEDYNLAGSNYAYLDTFTGFTNYTWLNLNFTTPILLRENTYYAYTIRARQGFSCCTNCLDMIFTYDRFGLTTGGWQGNDAGMITNNSGVFTTTTSYSDYSFILNFTTDVYDNYDESQIPLFENCINSPRQNCLFYDEFSYNNLYNLSLSGYIWNPELWTVNNQEIFSAFNTSEFNAIGHEFETTDYNYNTVSWDYVINTESGTTPNHLDTSIFPTNYTYLVYQVYLFCDTALLNEFMMIFWADQNRTGSDTNSFMNLYDVSGEDMRPFGSFQIENGEEIIIHGEAFINEGFYQLNIRGSSAFNLLNEVGHDVVFPMQLDSTCIPDTFRIVRDGTFEQENDFVRFETVSYWGSTSFVDDGTQTDDYSFTYGNRTLQNDTIVEGAVGELLHNMAFTLGFKSTGGRLLFWILVIIILSVIAGYNISQRTTQSYVIGFIVIAGTVSGWYFKFLPTVLFAFLILIVAIVGAIFITKLTTKSGSGG